jgi:hypothetical protein
MSRWQKNGIVAAVVVILILHGPNGREIYVAAEHVVSVLQAGINHPGARAVVDTQGHSLYVRETPAEVAKMLDEAKK